MVQLKKGLESILNALAFKQVQFGLVAMCGALKADGVIHFPWLAITAPLWIPTLIATVTVFVKVLLRLASGRS